MRPSTTTPAPTVTFALLATLLLGGCATQSDNGRVLSRDAETRVVQPTVFPMSLDDVRRMTRDGKTPSDIIAELDRTSTLLDVKPSEANALVESGIHPDILDWLHQRQLDALGDGWKSKLAQQQQEHVKDLQRLRNEMELRAFTRYPFGYPYPYYRYGPGFHFGF